MHSSERTTQKPSGGRSSLAERLEHRGTRIAVATSVAWLQPIDLSVHDWLMDEPIVWRGQTMDDRSAERRAQLLDVGFDMIGTHGAPSVTLRAVCREAGLSPRYFYESFADREELLTAVYDHAEAGLLARLVPANEAAPKLSIREIIDICAEYFEEDPRRARTLLREPLSDDVLRSPSSRSVAGVPERNHPRAGGRGR